VKRPPSKDVLDKPSGGDGASGGGASNSIEHALESNDAVRGDGFGASGGTRGAPGAGGAGAITAKKAPPPPKPDADAEGGQEKLKLTPAEADKAATDLVLANEKSLKACLTKDAQAVSITIKVDANGKATAVVTAKAAVPAGVTKCIKTAVAKLAFAKAATTVSLQLEK
jgi:hypothetical protein